MTPAAIRLREDILRHGPVSFEHFMDVALYDAQHGYYRAGRDVFGRSGDFYTAQQVQPVFGILMAEFARTLQREMGDPPDFQVVELGAGRAEMAEAFRDFDYIPVEWDRSPAPGKMRGLVFANEFFDALPVRVFRWEDGIWRERLVAVDGESFIWTEGGAPDDEAAEYLDRYANPFEDGVLVEANLHALRWLEQVARSLERGCLAVIDYGYTRREAVRFPAGTLMTYRRHTAGKDVLEAPGSRDITAHVNFTALEEHAASLGLKRTRFETLARTLLSVGERDQFATVLAVRDEQEATRRRLQLKTLLFGMGETFRTMLLEVGPK